MRSGRRGHCEPRRQFQFRGLLGLDQVDPTWILSALKGEQPVTIGIVLAQLSASTRARILSQLPPAVRERVPAREDLKGARLEIMVNRLGAFDLAWQAGMPFAWLRLPLGWRASTFMRMAEDEGVFVRSADQYAPVHGRAPNAVRLAVAGGIPRQQYEAGLASLARLLPRPPNDMAV